MTHPHDVSRISELLIVKITIIGNHQQWIRKQKNNSLGVLPAHLPFPMKVLSMSKSIFSNSHLTQRSYRISILFLSLNFQGFSEDDRLQIENWMNREAAATRP
jgi:hypothetical protein